MEDNERIVGIDLGTSNSEVAIYNENNVDIIKDKVSGKKIFPSYVGLSPEGQLVVGEIAKNQYAAYPDRTIKSVKLLMGTEEKIKLGEKEYSPAEISAFILKGLISRVEKQLDIKVKKAVITVPAFFNDFQRKQTRLAGEIAGIEVLRIINEPTAASMVYGENSDEKTILIYDLGGGTFDVSIVKTFGGVNEILASHGDTHLGGDDFDKKLTELVITKYEEQNDIKLDLDEIAYRRLKFRIEKSKQELSYNPIVKVKEALLMDTNQKHVNIDVEISREEYEEAIKPLIKKTLVSVHKALSTSELTVSDLSSIILVGGSTRTPLVGEMLQELTRIVPNKEVDPDMCVSLGAGLLAGRLEGHEIDRILVDITPYAFGVSYRGMLNGIISSDCYKPIIPISSSLPCSFTEEFYTSSDYQETVEVNIFEGENPDARQNHHIGEYEIRGLAEVKSGNPIHVKMSLDIDGILHVTTSEKNTGKSKQISINNIFDKFDDKHIEESKERFDELWEDIEDDFMLEDEELDVDLLLNRSGRMLEFANESEKERINELMKLLEKYKKNGLDDIENIFKELESILFLIDDE